jgi:hypothetical protein
MNTLPDAFSSINLLPQSVAALILTFRALLPKDARAAQMTALVKWRGFALLALFVVYGVFTAFAFPHIFEGRVDVMSMEGAGRTRLEPSSANLNQSAYLVAELLSTLALFAYLKCDRSGEVREHLMKAFMLGGLLFVATGLIDYFGLFPQIVAMFKTASYNNFAAGEIVSFRRINGFFPEASAYGPKCVVFGALLYFGRSACRSNIWRKLLCPAVGMILVGMGALSTSSTAFVCIFMFLAMLGGRIAYMIYRKRRFGEYAMDLSILGIGGLVLLVAWMADPDLLTLPLNLLDALIFRKKESSSYYERSTWNSMGKMALHETYGIGVGVGSARTSNWAIAVLSNTGLLGFALMASFMTLLLYQKPTKTNPRWAAIAEGGKYAMVVFVLGELVSGTTVDPGEIFAILIATIAAGSAWSDGIGLSSRKKRAPTAAAGPPHGRPRSHRPHSPDQGAAQPSQPQTAFGAPQT